MKTAAELIRERLFSLADEKYKEFQAPLIPSVDPSLIIGIRTPILRSLARELHGTEAAREFLSELPHKYFEENNLHAFLIEKIRDFPVLRDELLRFLPYIDSWACCDSLNPPIFRRHPEGLLPLAYSLTESKETYTVRYGIGILMKHFLDEHFTPDILARVAEIDSEEYYVMMMQAWFFQAAYYKHRESTLPYFEEARLKTWVHNKAIQKCIESRTSVAAEKEYLRKLRRLNPL